MSIVKRYLMAVQRHYWAGIIGWVGVSAASVFVAMQPPPPITYKSEGILVYVAPPLTLSATATSIQEQARGVTGTGLISDEVVAFVAESLKAQDIEVSKGTLKKKVKANVSTDSALQVNVVYQGDDQERVNIINTLFMDALVDQSRVFNSIQINRIKDNLNELLPKIEADLKQAEAALEQYVRTEGPLLASAEDGTLIKAISAAQNNQISLKIAIEGLESQFTTLQDRLGLTPDQAYASSALSSDPIIANLRAELYRIESQDAILSQRLQPAHPEMTALETQKQAYEQLLQERFAEVIGGQNGTAPLKSAAQIRQDSSLDPARQQLANQLVTLHTELERQKQLLLAQQQLEQDLKNQYSQLPNKQIKQTELAQSIVYHQTFYADVQARLADVTLAEKETVGSFVVAQPAQVITTPEEASNPLVTIIAGSLVGIAVGGALIFFLDSVDPTFRLFSDIQKFLQEQEVPVLGVLPHVDPDEVQPHLMPVVTAIDAPYLDRLERFRSNLQRVTGKTPPKVVLVSSTTQAEGKSFTAYHLAIASARAGKRTLLLETDFRSPSNSSALNAEPDPESALNPIRYYDPLSHSIRLVPDIENLYILPSPGAQHQAAAILESSEMRRTLDDAKGRFDFIVLDSPSLSRANDALLMEPHSDGMILVTRPHHTEQGLLTEAIEQFIESETSTVKILGVVINDADIDLPSSSAADQEADDDSLNLTHLAIDSPEEDESLEQSDREREHSDREETNTMDDIYHEPHEIDIVMSHDEATVDTPDVFVRQE